MYTKKKDGLQPYKGKLFGVNKTLRGHFNKVSEEKDHKVEDPEEL